MKHYGQITDKKYAGDCFEGKTTQAHEISGWHILPNTTAKPREQTGEKVGEVAKLGL
jgi:hypothetical protein